MSHFRRQIVTLLLLSTLSAVAIGVFCAVPAAASPVAMDGCHRERTRPMPRPDNPSSYNPRSDNPQPGYRCCLSPRPPALVPMSFSLHPVMLSLPLTTSALIAVARRDRSRDASAASGSPPGTLTLRV